ncbi:MAG TPA: hypothetical protein VGQ42_11825 [Candidatus Dormibacteraeota bacterium]|nr:hypothetical protein [Candidatus Dormibacteraeota bacterium]
MSDEQSGARPSGQPDADRQRLAKLQGLERMRTAGLIAEPEYLRVLAKLEQSGPVAASGLPAAAAPGARRQAQYFVSGGQAEAAAAAPVEPVSTPGFTPGPEFSPEVAATPEAEAPQAEAPEADAPEAEAPVEPAHVDPAPVVPAHVDPAPVEPAHVDPAPVVHAHVDPAPVEPAHVDPAPVVPAHVDPAPVAAAATALAPEPPQAADGAPTAPASAAPVPPASSPPPPAYIPPALTPPPAARPMGRRGMAIAAALCVALLGAATGIGLVVTRSRSTGTGHSASTATPPPTPLPDPATALAPVRGITASTTGVIIDQPSADTFVRAFWPVRENALSHADPKAVRTLENGPAGEWDAIGCTMGCAPPAPRNIRDMHLFVPRQNAYPARFMAQVLTTEYHTVAPLVETMIFTRQSAAATWFLSFDTSYSNVDTIDEFAHPDTSSAFDSQPAIDPAANVDGLPALLAAYWQHWKEQGSAPVGSDFLPGAFTTEQGQQIAATRTDMHKAGIEEHATYTASPVRDGVWSFAVNYHSPSSTIDDAVLTCGTVRYTAVSTPAPPSPAIDHRELLDGYGSLLAPGRYSSVTLSGLHQSCFLTHEAQPWILVEGSNGKQTRVVGIPLNGGIAA